MDRVTDVIEFAAQHADYWNEFLSSKVGYGDVVTADELRALEAARLHIEEGIYALLVECGARLATKLGDHGVLSKTFQRAAALEHQRVWVPRPTKFEKRMYGFYVGLLEEGGHIVLRGTLVVKMRSMDAFGEALAAKSVSYSRDGAWVFKPGERLKKDTAFTSLADRVADDLGQLFAGVREMASP